LRGKSGGRGSSARVPEIDREPDREPDRDHDHDDDHDHDHDHDHGETVRTLRGGCVSASTSWFYGPTFSTAEESVECPSPGKIVLP
jgi:hypothetical protein